MPNDRPKTPGTAQAWKEFPKRKCNYCGKRFQPIRPDQRFCPPIESGKTSKCRSDFHHFGGSYMKIVEKLRRLIREEFTQSIEARLSACSQRIAALESAAARKRK